MEVLPYPPISAIYSLMVKESEPLALVRETCLVLQPYSRLLYEQLLLFSMCLDLLMVKESGLLAPVKETVTA